MPGAPFMRSMSGVFLLSIFQFRFSLFCAVLTPSVTPALTLDASISCILLALFSPLTSVVFNTLQPLFPNAPFASRTDLREHGGLHPSSQKTLGPFLSSKSRHSPLSLSESTL